MKVLDVVYSYADGTPHLTHGLCRVRSFVSQGGVVVLLTDLGDKNDGQSVTNAVENIIKGLQGQGIVVGSAIFIEHYERELSLADTFDVVTIQSTGLPLWKSISRAAVLKLTASSTAELEQRSWENARIVAQSDQLRFSRDRFVDSPFLESSEITKRRLEIADQVISKSQLVALVNEGAGERELQALLKKDLSVFGEAYAKPDDEYICFSEFPLGEGFVDFAVFTGRSRMDVILIEVKGAEFNLTNSDHYGEFNHKISQAAGQLRSRLGHIYRNGMTFRDHVHGIREKVESGVSLYNSFCGPMRGLHVDPQKDINIRTVLIGGRTVNDRVESAKRHDYERSLTPPTRIESWDTWLRRLQRR